MKHGCLILTFLAAAVAFGPLPGCGTMPSRPLPTPTPIDQPVPIPTPIDQPKQRPLPDSAPPHHGVTTTTTTPADSAYRSVTLYYATDRNLQADRPLDERYGSGRGSLTYGTCSVSVPRSHKKGEVERPNYWKLDFFENPDRHIMLHEISLLDNAAFFENLGAEITATAHKNAFVFIHGYNVSFADAALRTAQMAYDFGYHTENRIIPVFFSWPSQNHTPAYVMDEDNVEWAQTDLKAFLSDFANQSKAEHIYLIAHSMGNRALTRAVVALLNERPELKNRFQEIILAAPDMDAEVFKRDIAPKISAANIPITLYTSTTDKALSASKLLHGYLRAGETGQGMVILPGIETIDSTRVTSDDWLLGHSYYGSVSILNDLYSLILDGKRAAQRFSIQLAPGGKYYEFQ